MRERGERVRVVRERGGERGERETEERDLHEAKHNAKLNK